MASCNSGVLLCLQHTWEVIGLQQLAERLAPVAAEDEVVPLGDDVPERAAVLRLAEGHAALHAARRLRPQPATDVARVVDLVPVADALLRRAVHCGLAGVLHEAAVGKIMTRFSG